MQRTMYDLICSEHNCDSPAKVYYYDINQRMVFLCKRCMKKHLYIYSKYVCYYCGREYSTKFKPLRSGKNIVCKKCFWQIKNGKNIKIDEGKKKVSCLGGNIDIEMLRD